MTDTALLTLAEAARARAYAPYSGYSVGAAALCRDGRVYTGCNIENASYGACLCAERAALAGAVSGGNREIVKIAVAGSGDGLCTPCGICRQVISELSPECLVVCGRRSPAEGPAEPAAQKDREGAVPSALTAETRSIREFLPDAFAGNMLASPP
ncbi:MAG: cytidine deaminase [Oscillospiraceae bacterium]|nr:cytidine deaminase [Oscillospiraceae bacterium]